MKYIASCSFGKDSLATIILCKEYGEPLDRVVYSEVMYDENISGEHPVHRDFIYNTAIPLLIEWGIPVDVVRSKETYKSIFYKVTMRSKYPERIGKLYGFPIPFKCNVNALCKVIPIRAYYKKIKEPIIQYVGIAIDEPKRLERLRGTNKISLLEKYKLTEKDAEELCKKYNLYSPIYEITSRTGCWMCPNMRLSDRASFIKDYPELWGELGNLAKEPNLRTELFDRERSYEQLDSLIRNKYLPN